MRKVSIVVMCAVLALGLAGCPKPSIELSSALVSLNADNEYTGVVAVSNAGKGKLDWTATISNTGTIQDVITIDPATGEDVQAGEENAQDITITATEEAIAALATEGEIIEYVTVSKTAAEKADVVESAVVEVSITVAAPVVEGEEEGEEVAE